MNLISRPAVYIDFLHSLAKVLFYLDLYSNVLVRLPQIGLNVALVGNVRTVIL